jgi:hypothetical protein
MAIQTIERQVDACKKQRASSTAGPAMTPAVLCRENGPFAVRRARAMPMNNSLAHFLAPPRAAQAEHNPSAASQQNVARFSELSPMISLNFEQSGFHAGGAAQPP